MTLGYPRLLGDVGGTNARWAWQARPDQPPQSLRVQPCALDDSLAASARRYLADGGLGRPAWVSIGLATAITGDWVSMTNGRWSFSIEALRRELGAERCLVINDFTALALSLPALNAGDLRAIGGGQPVAGAPLALLGPGTGLGVSGLLRGADAGATPLNGEGGHVTLAATNDREAEVLAVMRGRFGHVSAERALSGPGLVHLREALAAVQGQPAPNLSPAEVTAAAIAGTDPLCVEALQLFTAFLGGVAGNLALTLGARGGVYLGGGIVPRLGAAFDDAAFRRAFEAKGRFERYLADIPCWVITAPAPALLGASVALDRGTG